MKKAVLTGHSKGLGAAIAADLLGRGIAVLGLSRSKSDGAAHPLLIEVALDLADADALAGWLAGGDLTRFLAGAQTSLLINNAGVVAPIAPLGRQSAADLIRMVSLNVTGPLILSDAFAATTDGKPDRRILHISSGAGRKPYPSWSAYCATKAALDHHASAVQTDALPGLRISSLAPGIIDTAMQATIRSTPAEDFPLLERFQGFKADGALSSPADAARTITTYLLSDGFGSDSLTDIRTLS